MTSSVESTDRPPDHSGIGSAPMSEAHALRVYRAGRPRPEEVSDFERALRQNELFSEERLAATRALIERVGRGEYVLERPRENGE